MNVLEVYVTKGDSLQVPDTCFELLSPDERLRAGRFQFEADRNTFIQAHGVLREILGQKLRQEPSSIQFTQNVYGKPILPSAQLHFNLTHTREVFAIAVSEKLPVGIDIENYARAINWEPIVTSFFSENERKWIKQHAPEDQQRAFFTLWTRKEAVLKAIGCGVVNHLARVDVVDHTFECKTGILEDVTCDYPRWHLKSECHNLHVISVAMPADFEIKWL